MSMEEVNAGLRQVQNDFNTRSETVLALAGEERFATLPERCAEAGALALKLATLLGNIHNDATEYTNGVLLDYYTNNPDCTFAARQAVAGSGDAELLKVPDIIMTAPDHGLDALVTHPVAGWVAEVEHSARTVRAVADPLEELADVLKTATEKMTQRYTAASTRVSDIIDNYIRE